MGIEYFITVFILFLSTEIRRFNYPVMKLRWRIVAQVQ